MGKAMEQIIMNVYPSFDLVMFPASQAKLGEVRVARRCLASHRQVR